MAKDQNNMAKDQNRENVAKDIKDVKDIKISMFQATTTKIKFVLKFTNDISLIELFNIIKVSDMIPFVSLNYNDRIIYKVYEKINIPDEWLSLLDSGILNIKVYQLDKYDPYSKHKYTTVEISNNEMFFDIDLKNTKISKEKIKERILTSLDIVKPVIDKEEKLLEKGFFMVDIPNFQRYIFADLVATNKIVSSYIFMNELELSAMQKKKFFLHYLEHSIKNVEDALTFIITPYDSNVKITIQKSKDIQQMERFKKDIIKILRIYVDEFENIFNIYKNILFQEKTDIKVVHKRELKTKKNLGQLQEFYPDLFGYPAYGRIVQAKHQPSVIDKDEFDLLVDDDKNLAMNVDIPKPSTYYSCQNQKIHNNIYPGLKKNTGIGKLKKEINIEEWKKKYPYLPICFKKPQIQPPKGAYRRYINEKQGYEYEPVRKNIYIKQDIYKIVGQDNFGTIPNDLAFIFPDANNIFRFGVLSSANSFIHCLALAFDKEYNKTEQFVRNIREKIYKDKRYLNLISQENVDININEYIKNLDLYFDPNRFVKALEHYYDCNIFLYEVNYLSKNFGSVSLPHYNDGYFSYKKDPTKRSVIIIKYFTNDISIPFQCEILFDTKNKDRFVFTKKIVKYNITTMNESLSQFLLVEKSLKPIKNIIKPLFFEKALSQSLDSNGRIKILNFKTFSLHLNSFPPLFLPIDDKPVITKDIQSISPIISSSNIVGKTSDDKAIIIDTPGAEAGAGAGVLGFIMVQNIDRSLKIVNDTHYINITYDKISNLNIFHKNKQIAEYLKVYTLIIFAKKNGHLSKKDFIVRPNHVYDIEILNNKFIPNNDVMFENNRLIIPSKDIRRKLLFSIKVQTLNNPKLIEEYKNRTTIITSFNNIYDFLFREKQLIFLSYNDITSWINIKQSQTEINNTYDSNSERPSFFEIDIDGIVRYGIFQNVYNHSLERALYVSYIWNKKNINMGFNSPKISDIKDIDIKDIRDIKENSVIHKAQNFKQPGEYNVFKYQTFDGYAAILFFK